MKHLIKLPFLILLLSLIVVSCKKEDPKPTPKPEPKPKEEAPALTQKVNKFMEETMKDIYLWYEQIPEIDTRYEFNSLKYFSKLLTEEDRWSYATDDAKALEDSFKGISKTYGWSLAFGRFSNTGTIFAIVEFVYPDTPASKAGIKRGDIILGLNNGDITDKNYRKLLSGESANFTLGTYDGNSISASSKIDLTALELQLNPVLQTNVIEHDGHKIGYMLYAQYISDFNAAIDTALQGMIDKGVSDIVVDLRYNPGGTISAAKHLCSSLAPVNVVNNNSKLVTFRWNNKYQDYFTSNQIMNQLEVYFDKEVPVKMGLDKIHFLIGSGTASASELTITGLKPYMSSVTTVGDTTHGKYTASITLKPEDIYSKKGKSYYEEIENWAIQPIVIRYANSVGVTDFKNGFAPDISVKDDLFGGIPLGTKEEPLLKAAIEDITGTTIAATKSAQKIDIDYTIFDRGFSEFDKNKREVLIEKTDFEVLPQ